MTIYNNSQDGVPLLPMTDVDTRSYTAAYRRDDSERSLILFWQIGRKKEEKPSLLRSC